MVVMFVKCVVGGCGDGFKKWCEGVEGLCWIYSFFFCVYKGKFCYRLNVEFNVKIVEKVWLMSVRRGYS